MQARVTKNIAGTELRRGTVVLVLGWGDFDYDVQVLNIEDENEPYEVDLKDLVHLDGRPIQESEVPSEES